MEEPRIPFSTLVRRRSKGFIIATFLAVLELTRQHYLRLDLSAGPADFAIEEREEKPLQPEDPALSDLPEPSGDGAPPEASSE
jgi:segregation and condensation protein A